MSLRCHKTRDRLRIGVAVLGAVLMHRAETAPSLKVCVDETNPTASMDLGVARAALGTQGYTVDSVPFVGHGKQADDGFPIRRFATMAKSECALIMGFPVDVTDPHLPPDVKSTRAYASTGFVLVERAGTPSKALTELAAGSEVGIAELDTWAGLLYASHPNIVMHVYPADADMLADLEHRNIAAGLTWQPYFEAYEKKHASRARLVARALPDAHMNWNLVALYAAGSEDVAGAFGNGIGALRDGGKLKPLIEPYRAAIVLDDSARTSAAGARTDTHRQCGESARKAKKHAPPALYTEDQATRGATSYYQNCAMCHGPRMDGQAGGFPGPALKGEDFADPSYDFHVDEIFRFVAVLMPAATPGSLSHETNVNIMAFILKENGYPAGRTELTYDGAMKSRVPIRYYGD